MLTMPGDCIISGTGKKQRKRLPERETLTAKLLNNKPRRLIAMPIEEMLELVKERLQIEDDSRDLLISDVIQECLSYCNLKEPPAELEPFIRRKIKTILDYEAENGANVVFDVETIKEGDISITYNTDEVSRETIYGLSDQDKRLLARYRRLRR